MWSFFDLEEAFNAVNHKIFLQKLEYHGIKGKAKDWFSSFIQNRQESTSINSEFNKISHGVPKGSVLGPLYVSLYLNNLH